MKKLLTILGAVGLTATAGTTVVACGTNNKDDKYKDYQKMTIDQYLGDSRPTNLDNPKIWLDITWFKENGELKKLTDAEVAQVVYTGILNSDDDNNQAMFKEFGVKDKLIVDELTNAINKLELKINKEDATDNQTIYSNDGDSAIFSDVTIEVKQDFESRVTVGKNDKSLIQVSKTKVDGPSADQRLQIRLSNKK